jgi:GTP pyrophosphokinase
VVDLPAGATPLDFAYQVHTNIGHHCRGARVNGRMVQLTQPLQNGDKVEILTAKNAHPSRDWLFPQAGYLVSPRSRSKVRAWFRQQDQEQNRRSGKQALEKEMARLGLSLDLEPVAKRFGLGSVEQLWLGIGAGDLTLPAVISACERELPQTGPKPGDEVQVKVRRPAYTEAAVSISGVGDLMTNFARCCRPLPPEPIAGYITLGRGVSIHRANCTNLLRLQADTPERLMQVEWGARAAGSYPVDIEVEAWDRTGLIRDISALLADEKIDINAMSSRMERATHVATIDITLGIASLEQLSRVMHRIGRLSNVSAVRRKA